MNSIKQRVLKIQKVNPQWSSFTCLAESIKGRGCSKRIIVKWFGKLVKKDEYAKKDRKAILKFLSSI